MMNRQRGTDTVLPRPMQRAESLAGPLVTSILREVQEWSGITAQDLKQRYPGSAARVSPALTGLVNAGLVTPVPVYRTSRNRVIGDPGDLRTGERVAETVDMHYLTDEAATYAARLDRVAVNRVRRRVGVALEQDHRPERPHRAHTVGLNGLASSLMAGGIWAGAGWRSILNLPGHTQLSPDAVVPAEGGGRQCSGRVHRRTVRAKGPCRRTHPPAATPPCCQEW